MKSIQDSNLLSRCGIYCGACYIYRAFKDGGEFLRTVADEQGVSKAEVRCEGCLGPSEELWHNCKECSVSPCLREKGFKFCYECPKFENSCEKYERLSLFCLQRGEHVKKSLLRIKAGQTEALLREQDRKWRCNACNKPISWYEKECHHCGHPLQTGP